MVRSEFGPVWLLTILVYLLKLLYVNSCVVWRSYGPLYVFIHFSAAFCAAPCALDLARDHAPWKCPLLLFLESFRLIASPTLQVPQFPDLVNTGILL